MNSPVPVRSVAYDKMAVGDFDSALAIFLDIFDGRDIEAAACLGWLYLRKSSKNYNPAEALKYYKIAAAGGDGAANYYVANCLYKERRLNEALASYMIAADTGIAEGAFNAYKILRILGRPDEAIAMREKAINMGHAFAARDRALEMMYGHRGLLKIPYGALTLARLAPRIIRHAKTTVGYKRLK